MASIRKSGLNFMTSTKSILGIVLSLCMSLGVVAALGQGGIYLSGFSVIFVCWVIAFSANWIMFVPAYAYKTEHYYDLTGSATYICVTFTALACAPDLTARDVILGSLIMVWALRLGFFLFSRIRRQGVDVRFNKIKQDFWWFLMTWTLQGLWVFLTLCMAITAITSGHKQPLGLFAGIGVMLWLVGFSFEVVADRQKSVFRNDESNEKAFITTGLWSYSRHPNYFGEMILWIGIAMIAAPVLVGWQWVALISPLFVIFLLTKVSGVQLLESQALRRWGDDPEYRRYLETTPSLIPRLPKIF